MTKTVGVPDTASNDRAFGLGGIISMLVLTIEPRAPGAMPNAPSPTMVPVTLDAHTPAQSAPGGPGSPGYAPSTFSTSRKFSPTARMCRAPLAGPVPPFVQRSGSMPGTALSPFSAPLGMGFSCTLPGMITGVVATRRSTLVRPCRGLLLGGRCWSTHELQSAVPSVSMGHSDATVRTTACVALAPTV